MSPAPKGSEGAYVPPADGDGQLQRGISMISNCYTPAPRFSVRLAPNANWAVAARLGSGGAELELWDRRSGGFVAQETGIRVALADQILPLGDGRIVVCSSAGKRHAVDVIDRPTFSRRRVANLVCQTARVLPASEAGPDRRPWALCREENITTLTRLNLDTAGTCGPVSADITLPGTYIGGVWTDHRGHSLALGHSDGGQPCSTVELSIADGTVRSLFRVTDRSQRMPAALRGSVINIFGAERTGFSPTNWLRRTAQLKLSGSTPVVPGSWCTSSGGCALCWIAST
jgi:hypothetical protein